MKTLSFLAFATLIAGAAVWPGTASAKVARCHMTIEGQTYLNGRCSFHFLPRISDEPGGSFQIRGNGYVAQIQTNGDGTAYGYWNEIQGARRVRTPLGLLVRNGACWTNTNAVICAN